MDADNKRLKALGSAAAGFAHDINNHLTVILNYLESENVQGARDAVSRCATLASGLLSWCRGQSLRPRRIDPARFLLEFSATLRLPENITLKWELQRHEHIFADTAALSRILTNLVSNASDAMNHGGVIRIVLHGRTIAIEDNGPGIPPEIADRIFDPFFTTKGTRGTGLGLAIVREIMTLHSGTVSLHAVAPHGARFELHFPEPAGGDIQPIN